VQNSSWIQPPRPFTVIGNRSFSSHTESDSANVVFTSAVALAEALEMTTCSQNAP